jgi:hypothetical protein
VGEDDKQTTKPLDRKPYVPLARVLDAVKTGVADADLVSTLAARLTRLERQLTDRQEKAIETAAGVRHAYFLGADEPYEKLKRALKAEIDEGEWAKLYSATSAPFDAPKSGKIGVKVINHYGDEVMKVYPVAAPTLTTGKAR